MGQVHPIIWICIVICMIMLIWTLWKKQIVLIVCNGIVGLFVMVVTNSMVPQSIQIGINYLTLSCSALLGVPGIVMLYVISYAMK